MKYIIIGLGNFGASLAEKLTALGNEVIGVDTRMTKVDSYKEKISHTICLDATDEVIASGLPLKDTDIVIVAIGEDQGANVIATAIFKNLHVKRLISRAINPLHEKILQAIGVDEIVHPEEETAERWAKKLGLTNVVDSFALNGDYSIIEANVPAEYVGKTVEQVGISRDFGLLLLTTIKKSELKNILDKDYTHTIIRGVATPDLVLEKTDIMVLYGSNRDLQRFLKAKK